jgi:LacI family transcriptional regulator
VMPALTTVRMPLRELGARAVRSLLDTPPDAPVEMLLGDDFALVRRESTAPLG